ncbi:hypothetical protein H2200_010544 [Cladophialophora chaetospira]|uniref:F-box domain-containing protein n=1 Tax=Cladophialophora chaetospira TaxID=386627 RepID=A0AA38X1P4_9EURO|nr:hypothetical protein H2200_010544 [Cladophialophora chaetospira]
MSGHPAAAAANWPSSPPSWTNVDTTPHLANSHDGQASPQIRGGMRNARNPGCRKNQETLPDTPPQPDPYSPFFIPQNILLDTPISAQTTSKFLELPAEILTLIFKKVEVPYFQVSLALTCKTFARVAYQKNSMSPWRGYRDKDGLFRLLTRKTKCPPYMPDNFSLCRACFRFRSREMAYWEKELKSPEFDSMKANWYDIFSWFEPKYQQHRCPWCTILGYTGYFREGQYLADKDLDPKARNHPMCPDLSRRIEKP